MGCGQPAGEAGFNIARVVADPGRARRRPGRDRQPLLLVEPADDPHGRPRDQGRRGRLLHRRRRRDRQPLRRPAPATRPRTTIFKPAGERTLERSRGGSRRGRRPRACPTSTSRWARPPRTWSSRERHPRGDGRVRQALAGPRRRQRRERLLRRRDHARHAARRHRRVARTTARGPAPRSRGWPAAQAGVPPRRHGHGRQRLPAQRRRRRGARDERHEGGASSASRRWPASCRPACPALNPEIMGLGPIEASRQALRPGRHDDRRHRPRRDQRGVRRPGASRRPSTSASTSRQAQRARRRRSPSATRSA